MATIGSLTIDLQAEVAGLRNDLARANREIRASSNRFSRSLGSMESGFERLNRQSAVAATAIKGFVAALGVRELVRFANASLQASAALDDTANRLGLSAEALQEYRFAAEQTGVAQNTLDQALQRFTRRLGEAQQGGGELLATLEQYDIALRDSNGTARSASDVLLDYADAIAGAESSQEQLRLAFKGFDSEGAALVNLLREGREGIQSFAGEARELGLILDNEMVAASAETARQIDLLNQVLRTNFEQGLMSGLAEDTQSVSEAMNDPALREAARFFGETLAGGIGLAADEMYRLMQFADALNRLNLNDLLGAMDFMGLRGRVLGAIGGPNAPQNQVDPINLPGMGMDSLGLNLGDRDGRPPQAINLPGADMASLPLRIPVREVDEGTEAVARLSAGLSEAQREAEQQAEAMRALGRSIEESVMTPSERYRARLAELKELYDANAIGAETLRRASAEAMEDLSRATATTGDDFQDLRDEISEVGRAAQQMADTAVSGLLDAAMGADNFGDALRGVLLRLADIAAQAAFQPISQGIGSFFSNLFGGGGGPTIGGTPVPLPPALPAFRADGGSVRSGSPYIVGEEGPELFMPGRSGTIIPNDRLDPGGGGMTQVNNITINMQGGGGSEEDAKRIGKAVRQALDARMSEWARNNARVGGAFNPI